MGKYAYDAYACAYAYDCDYDDYRMDACMYVCMYGRIAPESPHRTQSGPEYVRCNATVGVGWMMRAYRRISACIRLRLCSVLACMGRGRRTDRLSDCQTDRQTDKGRSGISGSNVAIHTSSFSRCKAGQQNPAT